MGTSKTAAEFAGKVGRLADAVARQLPAECARQNAGTVERLVGGAVSSMSGGDDRLSGAGPVGVTTVAVAGTVAVAPRGPVALVENPTPPHEIGAGGTKLRLGDHWVTGPVRHRGTRGKGQWRRARDQLTPVVRADTAKAMTSTAKGVFG